MEVTCSQSTLFKHNKDEMFYDYIRSLKSYPCCSALLCPFLDLVFYNVNPQEVVRIIQGKRMFEYDCRTFEKMMNKITESLCQSRIIPTP